ncbi:putative endosome-associated ubiquitin isopeptidase [Golovinomyces cichoracearum]|uniref:Putative endosome-associated ubiquitin isopeptidase n=1 Tax=Golovinomyces cichoracearum TaxID=62708 RepID=A0A420J2Y5_9PEZI|nr:putative endosome-associated ubiquitin isopeptidase [Golovinomyces cichoracearum]
MTEPPLEALRPFSTKDLAIKAQEFEFNILIPPKYWIRTSDTLLREALIYEQEGNDQQAYLLLMRYASLVTEKFPLLPSYRDPEYRMAFKLVKNNMPRVLDLMETLKPRINSRFNAWIRTESLTETKDQKQNRMRNYLKNSTASSLDPAVAGNSSTLSAVENRELAVKLAQEEICRRNVLRKAKSSRTTPRYLEPGEQALRISGDWNSTQLDDEGSTRDETRGLVQESRRLISRSYTVSTDHDSEVSNKPKQSCSSNASDYRYPNVAKPQPYTYQTELPKRAKESFSYAPEIPPKKFYQDPSSFEEVLPPPRPRGIFIDNKVEQPIPPKDDGPVFTFRPSSYLENGNPLRTIFLPMGLRTQFLKYAEPNTRRNLETCGMLCGTLISNALFIRRVVIPEQESTCDTCETTNEGALFEYCDKEDLLVLGWIHTHPTQTCFMSSRDLHTHCGYQIMMPESIAIVCAPSKSPSWGVFRLTDPPGLGSILNCTHTDFFHPHSETNLYTDALRPGHVVEADGMEFKVIDLRPL